MFNIGNIVSVFMNNNTDTYRSFIARVIGLDYDRETVFVYDDKQNTYEVPFNSTMKVFNNEA